MSVELNTSSKELTNYFNSPTQGKGYWEIFDHHIQQFLSVRDLIAFFGTSKAFGRHKSTLSFKDAFIQSRCSPKQLTELARDFFLHRLTDNWHTRIVKSLPAPERVFLQKGRTSVCWTPKIYYLKPEEFEKMSEEEREALIQEENALNEESNQLEKQWNKYMNFSPVDKKSPIEEEDELIISLDEKDTPVDPVVQEPSVAEALETLGFLDDDEPLDPALQEPAEPPNQLPIEPPIRPNPCKLALALLTGAVIYVGPSTIITLLKRFKVLSDS